MQRQYLILDTAHVNSISRWAFSAGVAFEYPVRHYVLLIDLDPLQELEFQSVFVDRVSPLDGEVCALI